MNNSLIFTSTMAGNYMIVVVSAVIFAFLVFTIIECISDMIEEWREERRNDKI